MFVFVKYYLQYCDPDYGLDGTLLSYFFCRISFHSQTFRAMSASSHPYLTTLTPLRGIAALIVVAFHCNLALMNFLPPGYTQFINNAWLWVDFFFVLSGFIMCYVYSKYFKNGVTWTKFRKFIGARFARIYPLYFITTIFSFITTAFVLHYARSIHPFFAAIFNLKALPACLLLIQSLHLYITAPLNTPSWSLSTEWWAYMIFPFLVPFFIGLKQPGKLFTALAIIGFFVFLRYVVGPHEFVGTGPTINMIASFALLRCLAGFWLGMLLFTFYENRSGFAIIKQDWFFALSLLIVLAAMHFGVMDIVIILLFPFILLSAAYNDTRVKRILDTRLMQRIGDWSFSIYMVHMPLISIFWIFAVKNNPDTFGSFGGPGPKPNYLLGAALCTFIICITLIAAALSYRFIEVPARNYFNKLFKTKHQQTAEQEPLIAS